MFLSAAIAAILLTLMLLLHSVTQRRLRTLDEEVERLRKLLEVSNERAHGPPPSPPAPPHPPTARHTQRMPEPSPHANPRLGEPSPRGIARLGEPSPRASPRIPEPSPRASPRLAEQSPRASSALSERAAEAGWAPTHRITFTPEHGRGESWLVMVSPAQVGGRQAATKAEWSAGVEPAWHCDLAGAWTYRGQRTPADARGAVKVEEFRP